MKDYELAQAVAQARRDNALARNERILRRRTALFMPLITLLFPPHITGWGEAWS